MEDVESHDTEVETLDDQFEKGKVSRYGDMSFVKDKVCSFMGVHKPKCENSKISALNSRDVKLASLEAMAGKNDKGAKIALEKELNERKFYDEAFEYLGRKHGFLHKGNKEGETNFSCFRELIGHWEKSCGKMTDYGLKFFAFFYNFCKVSSDLAELKADIVELC